MDRNLREWKAAALVLGWDVEVLPTSNLGGGCRMQGGVIRCGLCIEPKTVEDIGRPCRQEMCPLVSTTPIYDQLRVEAFDQVMWSNWGGDPDSDAKAGRKATAHMRNEAGA